MNCFCGMVGLRTADSRISARIGHHLDFPKCRGMNRSRIGETAIVNFYNSAPQMWIFKFEFAEVIHIVSNASTAGLGKKSWSFTLSF